MNGIKFTIDGLPLVGSDEELNVIQQARECREKEYPHLADITDLDDTQRVYTISLGGFMALSQGEQLTAEEEEVYERSRRYLEEKLKRQEMELAEKRLRLEQKQAAKAEKKKMKKDKKKKDKKKKKGKKHKN